MALQLKRLEDFDAYKVNFKGFRISGTATAGQVTDIDYRLADGRLVYGGQAILKNHVFGDIITFQVVDVDNLFGYGAGTVLGEYIPSWGVADDTQTQAPIMVTYPTEIFTGLYLRIKYNSTGTNNVSVQINIFAAKNVT